MRGKKSSIFDGGHRVPCFIHWPAGGLVGGKKVETLCAHIDLLPTLADLCGLPAPNESYDVDGKSLVPLLDGSGRNWKRSHHFIQYHGGRGNTDPLGAGVNSVILTEQWRLLRNPNAPELYDIEADPAQRKNLASRFPRIVEELELAYEPFWQRVSKGLRPVPIAVGDPTENPAVLCSQDWRPDSGNPPWNFNGIKKIPKVTHPWLVKVMRPGKYRITLTAVAQRGGKPILANRALLKIAGSQRESAIKPGSSGVAFEMTLPEGITELWTYLFNEAGEVGGFISPRSKPCEFFYAMLPIEAWKISLFSSFLDSDVTFHPQPAHDCPNFFPIFSFLRIHSGLALSERHFRSCR